MYFRTHSVESVKTAAVDICNYEKNELLQFLQNQQYVYDSTFKDVAMSIAV